MVLVVEWAEESLQCDRRWADGEIEKRIQKGCVGTMRKGENAGGK